MFEAPAWLITQFYSLTHSYAAAIGLVAVCVMLLVMPLTLKSTKGMLEMQKLQPEMRRLQNQYRGDRVKLNEEMMKLYQEHKVNPLASCLPMLLQFPVFIIMFRVLHGLTRENPDGTFNPKYISHGSDLFKDLAGSREMLSLGLDLSLRPVNVIQDSFGKGLIYAGLVVLYGGLMVIQQRMVASRAAASPTMSPTQQKVMQYLPVVFAFFQLFFLTGLIVYYIVQSLVRIAQNAYITRRFYGHDEALGRQAQRAAELAREEAKSSGGRTGEKVGLWESAKRDAQARRDAQGKGAPTRPGGANRKPATSSGASTETPGKASSRPAASNGKAGSPAPNKRVTPPKNRPTPSARPSARPRRPQKPSSD
jgi:YidC/Oxa1 family membrane protein insertase